MLRKLFAALSIGATTFAITAPTQSLGETLGDAMAGAYKSSGLLEQNRALLRAADEDVAIALSALRPVVGWSASAKRDFTRTTIGNTITTKSASTTLNAGISVSMTLYDFGANRIGVESAKEAVLATRQGLVGIEQSVLLGAVQAYMGVRRADEIVALEQNNVGVLEKELRAAKDRFDVGEVTRTDVATAQARLSGAHSGLAVAKRDAASAREVYKAVVGHKPKRLSAHLPLPKTPKTLAAAKSTALQNHPDLLAVQHSVAALDLAVKQAEASMRPTLSISGQYGLTDPLDNPVENLGGSVTLQASGPIYQGGRIAASIRKVMAQRDAERAKLHLVRNSIEQNVGQAWARLAAARAAIEASDQQIRAATIAFRGVREEATLGSRTTLDVLNAKQELLNAQADSISARVEQQIASYTLLSEMGLMTVRNLGLQVQEYDPAAYYNMVKKAPSKMSAQGRQLDKVLRKIGKE